jgi:transposase
VIGTDPHKRSATIEVMTGEEIIVGGRFGTGCDGHAAMVRYVSGGGRAMTSRRPALRQ